ncbi:MAG: hypothetical protein U0R26_08180 [Solirubrobacterales bacterium]
MSCATSPAAAPRSSEALAERGLDSPRAAQVAALDSRRAKEYGVGLEDLRALADARSRPRAEIPVPGIARETTQPATEPSPEELARAVTAERSHFDRREAARRSASSGTSGDRGASGGGARRRLPRLEQVVRIAEGTFGPRFSTPEILAIEQRVIGSAETLRGAAEAPSLPRSPRW